MNCAFHSGIAAAFKCTGCGADICDTCRIIVKNEDYCKKCVAQKIEGAAKKAGPLMGCLTAFLVTAFIIIPILGILAAIAIPNFIKARQGAMERARGGMIQSEGVSRDPVEVKSQEQVVTENNTLSDILLMKRADMYKVCLTNGQVFEAEIEKDAQDMYVFKIGNGTFEVNKSEVVEIKKME